MNAAIRLAVIGGLALVATLRGVEPVAAEPLTDEIKEAVLERLARGLEEKYVLVEKGKRVAAAIRQLRNDPAFVAAQDRGAFASLLTDRLLTIGDDLHFRVVDAAGGGGGMMRTRRSGPGGPGAAGGPQASDGPETSGGPRVMTRRGPGGEGPAGRMMRGGPSGPGETFTTHVLDGGVGVLVVNALFGRPEALDNALRALGDSSALILDLRGCPGGGGGLNVTLASVLFAQREVMMYMENRNGDRQPVYVEPQEDLPSFVDKPAFVLTSNRTGSACEEVAWDLKYHDKAIVVGDTTAGGGLGINEMTDLSHGFQAVIPGIRPVHPKTAIGFEGTGVRPDVEVPAHQAERAAHRLAVATLMADAPNADQRARWASTHAAVAENASRATLAEVRAGRALLAYEGRYAGGREIEVHGGKLYYRGLSKRRLRLEPLEGDEFAIDGTRGQKVRFGREKGQVVSIAISEPDDGPWGEVRPREDLR